MPSRPTLLRALITAKHWQRYETFAVQFGRAAEQLAGENGEPQLAKVSVSVRQFERWYGGKVRTSPHPDSCRILERMFGYPVQQLLAPVSCMSQLTPLAPGQHEPRTAVATTLHHGLIWSPGAKPSRDFRSDEDSDLPDPERILAMAARRAMQFSATAGSSNVAGESLDQLWAETSRLAIARVHAGNLDGAREAVRPVLDLPASQRIHGVVTSVLNVHRAITAHSVDAPVARDIQEEIESYCRTPAAALPR